MSPKTFYQLAQEWNALADDFNVTRGDSEVEGAYWKCAEQLEALIREWDAEFKVGTENLTAFTIYRVVQQVLGLLAEKP